MNYKPVIGLEVHVELKTKSKMFCGCSADYFGKEPNTHCCPVCLGLPGALPVPNKKAIEWCVMIGLALNCKIPLFSKFDRKNYFYPDLPKGYQISQYDEPFAVNGHIVIASKAKPGTRRCLAKQSQTNGIAASPTAPRNDNKKTIRIRRVHMEEDTAKLIHHGGGAWFDSEEELEKGPHPKITLIDFNRSGVPLVEIVTEPDFESAIEVIEYLKKLQQAVRYLGVSDADMEKGGMRLEPNISLAKMSLRGASDEAVYSDRREIAALRHVRRGLARDDTTTLPNYKVEVKNINSFRFVEKAINYEIERQKIILGAGKIPTQETRGWDEKRQITVTQRIKEEAMDYRYFPEPDIPPVHWRKSQISNLKSQISELPDAKFGRFVKEYGLPEYDAEIITREKELSDFFEEAVKVGNTYNLSPKQIANVIINKKIDIRNTLPGELIKNIVRSKQTSAVNVNELEEIVSTLLSQNKKAVTDYKNGKVQVIEFLIGKVKQTIKKPLDAEQVKKAIEKLINTD